MPGAALLVAAVLLVGCSEPAMDAPETAGGAEDPRAAEELDPHHDELVTAVEGLLTTVEDARADLDQAVRAESLGAVHAAARRALDRLLETPGEASGGLFPGTEAERERAGDHNDELTAVLAAARRAGGDLGRGVVEVLRDPVAGDLGTWERDPAGVVAAARDATAGTDDVDGAADAVRELQGEGVRALAWTILATETGSISTAHDAAERAATHLGVVAVAVEVLLDEDLAGEATP